MDTRKTQTPFFHRYFFTRYFKDMRIDICFPKILIFRIIFRQYIQIYYYNTNRKSNLWSSKPHTFCMVHRFEHIRY